MQTGHHENGTFANAWIPSPSVAGLLRKEAEDGWLVYDPQVGSTQLLSPLSYFLIEVLEQRKSPLDLAALIEAVQAEEPDSPLEECADATAQALSALAGAGLVSSYQP